MLVKKISFVRPNLLEYTLVIATAKNIVTLMDKEKTNFSEPGDPFIIVRKLTKEIIEEAVKAYAVVEILPFRRRS